MTNNNTHHFTALAFSLQPDTKIEQLLPTAGLVPAVNRTEIQEQQANTTTALIKIRNLSIPMYAEMMKDALLKEHFITDLGETDIEKMETLTKKRFQEALQIHKKHVPVTRAPYAQRWNALHHNIKTILEPLRDLKEVCVLLQKPENHLRVRSNQQTEKQVPTRTVADMVNEMEGELTELPKYTAMAKILQGQTVWKGKIRTLSLPSDVISKFKTIYISQGNNEMLECPIRNKPIIDEIIEDTQQTVCSARTQIEREIRKRQEKWKPTAVGEPRVVRDKNEKGPAGPQDKPVVEPDGPPPTSPKPRR